MYPRFLFHRELAAEGRLIKSEADEPTEEGWVDTPAAFDPAYVPPPPVAEEDRLPPEAIAAGYVRERYPSWRFNRAGEERLVKSADEDTLDPAEWKHSPAAFAEPPVASAPSTSPPGPGGAALSDEQRAEFYATTVPVIQTKVAEIPDAAFVARLFAVEEANPAGPRVSVLKALTKRLNELNTAKA